MGLRVTTIRAVKCTRLERVSAKSTAVQFLLLTFIFWFIPKMTTFPYLVQASIETAVREANSNINFLVQLHLKVFVTQLMSRTNKSHYLSMTSGPHGGGYEGGCFVGCSAV
jgi:hypothetical protein